jgi:sulfate adenylyltransferase subunit 1
VRRLVVRRDEIPDPVSAADDRGVLRFLTCGSVDDGKSTLIGRLLYDTKALLTDTLATLEKQAQRHGLSAPDLSLLTDGLVAEREQGITIDVAYRYFATAQRKFIIADSPGHVQYTRNMVTAASTADAAVLLVDARKGIVAQTRRHASIAGLLGVRHLIVAVNKMDLVDYSNVVFDSVGADFRAWLEQQPSLHVRTDFIPISALQGANVVERDARLAWYPGPTLIELLEQAPAHEADAQAPLRLPVQWVCRPSQIDFRAYAGRIESGALAVGDAVVVLPSGLTSRVAAIRIGERELDQAVAGESVLVQLADDIDISRGDLLAHAGASAAQPRSSFEATVCWLGQRALDTRREYLLRHGPRETRARIRQVTAQLDIETLSWKAGADSVEPNGLAQLAITTQHPIAADPYQELRATGSFILIDPAHFDTVAAGMIV